MTKCMSEDCQYFIADYNSVCEYCSNEYGRDLLHEFCESLEYTVIRDLPRIAKGLNAPESKRVSDLISTIDQASRELRAIFETEVVT